MPTQIIVLPKEYSTLDRAKLQKEYDDNLKQYFPYKPGGEREHFRETLTLVKRELDNPTGAKNIFIEWGTGLGKSGAVLTLGESVVDQGNSYYVLTSKIGLMGQYESEFKNLKPLKGRNNFKCLASESICESCPYDHDERQCTFKGGPCTADKAPCMVKRFKCEEKRTAKSDFEREVEPQTQCAYMNQYYAAALSPRVLSNPNYLFKVSSGEHTLFGQRSISFFDEAHNLPDVIRDIASKNLFQRDWEHAMDKNGELPLNFTTEKWKEILPEMAGNVGRKLKIIQEEMSDNASVIKSDNSTDYEKKIAMECFLANEKSEEKYLEMFERFNFIFGVLSSSATIVKTETSDRGVKYVSFTPIFVAPVANYILNQTSERRVFLSATFRDATHWVNNLGLGKDNNLFIFCEDSPFPVKNRPIYYLPQGSMSWKGKEKTLPKMIETIDKIISEHPGQHGIILPFSYDLGDSIVSLTSHKDRVFTHKKDKGNRDGMIEEFISGRSDSVIVSPYLNEGFNGNDERCRMLILCKCPYPSLHDELTSARMKHDQEWYQKNIKCEPKIDKDGLCNNYRCGQPCKGWYRLKAAIQIIQMCGRGVRHDKDWCHTYILDTAFGRLYKSNMELFPTYFRNAIISP